MRKMALPVSRCGGPWGLQLAISLLVLACPVGDAWAVTAGAPEPEPSALNLHVASPDWRDQVIYFVMTDRFDDGDSSNNDQGAGEFDPTNNAAYSGGDLRGLTRRIDYIKGLGATALWLTPPVANQWWDASIHYGGYHGYWAENFRQVDAHLGTLADYQALSHNIHNAGMYLVQDIVLNHTGNFFAYTGAWDARHLARNFSTIASPTGVTAPSQWPFSMNDVRNPVHRKAAIYHWTPNVADYNDRHQELNFQMSGLDDLNTENPVVRRALRDSYGYWIREVGVDAFRVDTAFYVPPEFVADFLYAQDKAAPGVRDVARSTGRKDFFVFGEGFGIDRPYEDRQARKIERYVTGKAGRPLMQGMLNFPLYGGASDVFARGRPTAELGYRIRRSMRLHAAPHLMPSFVDNHDVDRFLKGSDAVALQQNLALIMTLPGVPVIYYGTEQGFTEPRAAMFKAGFGSGGVDHFDPTAPLYQYIQRVTKLRRDNPVFSRGNPTVLRDCAAGAGALAYRMDDGKSQALVVFNTATTEVLLDNLATGLDDGALLQGVFALDGMAPDQVVGRMGRLSMRLPARSASVWLLAPNQGVQEKPLTKRSLDVVRMDPLARRVVAGDLVVSGRAPGMAQVRLVVDGDMAGAQAVAVQPDGRWRATISTEDMVDPALVHRVVAWSEASAAVSQAQTFSVARSWKTLADVADPAGDDAGPHGRYRYPLDVSWGVNHPLDMRRVKVSASGSSLRLDVTLHQLTTLWNPPNGFDHLVLTAFIELPGQSGGVSVMPLQHAQLPDGMLWHYRLRANGWSNALFSAQGASALHEGSPVGPAADIRVDRASHTIGLVLKAAALGHPATLSGAKVYITTWDYDGGYRPLARALSQDKFGGGAPDDPLVMDDVPVIILP